MAQVTEDKRFHHGLVTQWNSEEDWGEISSNDFDDPIWMHFSSIERSGQTASPGGYRSLHENDTVEFLAERADQDGYRWRATSVRSAEGDFSSGGTQP